MTQKPKILFVGPIGAGKSSFICSVDKIFNGHNSQLVHVEEDNFGTAVTKQVGNKLLNVFFVFLAHL